MTHSVYERIGLYTSRWFCHIYNITYFHVSELEVVQMKMKIKLQSVKWILKR